jgi:hypothetical protein
MAKKADHRERIEYFFKGRIFDATYTISSGMVHVTSLQGRKSAQFGEAAMQSVAEQLFRDIIQDADAVGCLR